MLHSDPAQRPTAAQLLQHPLFRERPRVRSCCVCLEEDVQLAEGPECTQGHFTCGACLGRYARAFAQADIRTLHKAEAKLHCKKLPTECQAAFSDAQVASTVPPDAFG